MKDLVWKPFSISNSRIHVKLWGLKRSKALNMNASIYLLFEVQPVHIMNLNKLLINELPNALLRFYPGFLWSVSLGSAE
jgi:hypothetical protein